MYKAAVLRVAAREGLTLVRTDNATGYTGVKRDARAKSKKFQARRWHNGKLEYLGNYATAEEAALPLLTHVEAMQVRCAGVGGVGDGGGALDFGVAALILALVCLALCGCWRGSECVERWVQGLPL